MENVADRPPALTPNVMNLTVDSRTMTVAREESLATLDVILAEVRELRAVIDRLEAEFRPLVDNPAARFWRRNGGRTGRDGTSGDS